MAKFGKVLKSKVLPESTAGLMLFEFSEAEPAYKAAAGMNGRWFNKKQIVAVCVTEEDYNKALAE